ncbi:MAG: KamA family radical SAM protein [Deltaproteobacteria bacterium]|nr:KamA family radical SAM protein [Deltaproteobacteria bacterium]
MEAGQIQSQPDTTARHRVGLEEGWWQERVPAWSRVDAATFHDHAWQLRNGVSRPSDLVPLVGDLVPDGFMDDLAAGLRIAPMCIRLTPYVLSLVDWTDPGPDPIRRQFVPLASEIEPDHPRCSLDALEEQRDSVLPGLVHRYPDKVLFLALQVCPVYCRFCTRSYAVGKDTGAVEKCSLGAGRDRWERTFEWIENHRGVEDVVVSGGDTWLLSSAMIRRIGERLLATAHVRRIRFASKGLAVLPQKILSDPEWLDVLAHLASEGRQRGVQVALHTHFNHPREITSVTRRAAQMLFERGIVVRNQSVLQRGVNDEPGCMTRLVRGLSRIQVQPYYVYVHDLVPGVECLRTSLAEALDLERAVRGQTAGFNTPTFVCDTIGGGGKRDAHSFEHYDRRLGIAVFRSPVVDPERPFFHFDPMRTLDRSVQAAWRCDRTQQEMIHSVLDQAGFGWSH